MTSPIKEKYYAQAFIWRFYGGLPVAIFKQFVKKADVLSGTLFSCRWKDRWPCLNDATATTGFCAYYRYHPACAACRILGIKPEKYIDIGSKLNLVTMLSAFLPVEFYDYRPADIFPSGLLFCHADLISLPFESNSIKSLSCMRVIEYIGLERYGDPFDPPDDLKVMSELIHVLTPGGHLYFFVPLGEIARIQYAAHKLDTYEHVLSTFTALSLEDFAFITNKGQFIERANTRVVVGSKHEYGCF